MGAADDVARLQAQLAEVQRSIGALQSDVHRAVNLAEQQGPRVAQGIQQGGAGLNRASNSAPDVARGLQNIGYGVGNLGTGISQAGGSFERGSANARSAGAEAATALAAGGVLSALIWGSVKVWRTYQRKHPRPNR